MGFQRSSNDSYYLIAFKSYFAWGCFAKNSTTSTLAVRCVPRRTTDELLAKTEDAGRVQLRGCKSSSSLPRRLRDLIKNGPDGVLKEDFYMRSRLGGSWLCALSPACSWPLRHRRLTAWARRAPFQLERLVERAPLPTLRFCPCAAAQKIDNRPAAFGDAPCMNCRFPPLS